VEFGILGPLIVRLDEREVPIGAAKQRALLTMLLLRRGEVVPTETLIDELWGERPPATAAKIVQVYVSQLRKALGEGHLETRPAGYMLRLGPDALDAVRFERLLSRARVLLADGDAREAGDLLREALGLWRGPPLAEFRYEDFARDEIGRLQDLHLAALEHRLEADLALGRHAEAVPELEALVRDHPLRESLLGLLMIALYRAGRQADALAAYQDARTTLVETLGLDPSESLQRLETAILRHSPTLDLAPATAQRAPPIPLRRPRARDPATAALAATSGRMRFALAHSSVVVLAAGALVAAAIAAFALRGGGSSRAALIAANSVGFIDAGGGYVRSQVSVDEAPTSVAVGESAVWAANGAAGTVSRIDPLSRVVQQTITVDGSPSGICVGGGGVWVASRDNGIVSWINPQSNAVVRTIRVGAGPTAVAYGYGSVWVTNADDRTVTRIAAHSGDVTATIRTNAVGRGIAVGGGSVWVTDEATRSVVEIDPATEAVASTATVGTGPTGIAYGDGSVWVANALDDTVSRIDATTLAVEATIPVPGGPSAVSFTKGAVWVSAEFGSRVVRIDPRRGAVVGSTPIGNRPEGLAPGPGGVWVAVQASGEGHRGGRLVVLGEGLGSIDPAEAGSTNSAAPLGAAYDGLTSVRHVGGSAGTQLVPDLAAALPLPTAGGTSYTFHLRPGIRYSDGRLLRAADFRRGLARALALAGPSAADFAQLDGAAGCLRHRSCDLSRSVIVGGRSTLTFRLAAPDARLLWKLTHLVPVPMGTPLHSGTRPIPATGPYAIESYVPGRLLTLVRNRYFHVWSAAARPDGNPDQIVYRVITDPVAAVRDVLAGRADLLSEAVPAASVRNLAARYPHQLHLASQQATTFVFLNVRRPPFTDVRVRRALNYAVDRERVAALHGSVLLAQPTCQLVPSTVTGYRPYCPYTIAPDASGEWKAPDLAKARALIRESGTRGQTIVVWSFSYFHRESQYFVSLLKQLGYRARLHYIPDIADYFSALARTPTAQAGFYGWFGESLAVDALGSVGCHYAPNPAHFCDRHVDAQLAQLAAREPVDPAGTVRLAAAIDREITDRAPWVPLFTPRFADLTSARVGNYQYNSGFNVLLDQLWVR
jgi:YVTN family beta-propeller protein